MPTSQGEYIAGAFELAFSEISMSGVATSEPGVAIAYAVALPAEVVGGGVESSIPEVAIAYALAVSPEVPAGVVSSIPEVAVMTAIAISPRFIPKGRAILGVFGMEPTVIADEWDIEPKIIASTWGAGVPK